MKTESRILVTPNELKKLSVNILTNYGLSSDHANIVADVLVRADLRGIESHGVSRLPIYIKRLKLGLIERSPIIKKVRNGPAFAVMDGGNGFGQIVTYMAMRETIEKAKKVGVGFVNVRNSNHFGMAAYYPMMALRQDMIGICSTNAFPTMTPWGGLSPIIGNNPLSIAIPAGKDAPFVLDMAMSVVARGKIRMAAQENREIPRGWAVNEKGEATTDPIEALRGFVLPIGGYKGYGLSLAMDMLSGVLAGGKFNGQLNSLYANLKEPQGTCHFAVAIDVSAFMEVKDFKTRMNNFIDQIRMSDLAKGISKIYLPGELEHEKENRRKHQGIPILVSLWQDLQKLEKNPDYEIPVSAR